MNNFKSHVTHGSQIDLITKRVTNRFKRRFILAVFCVPASIAWFDIVLRGINTGLDIFTTFLVAFISLIVLTLVFWPIYLITMDNQVNTTVTEMIADNRRLTPEAQVLLGDNVILEQPEEEEDEEIDAEEDIENSINDILTDPNQSRIAAQTVKNMLYEEQFKG